MKFYKQIYNLSFGICAATVKNIIRQNKKAALQEFLFGKNEVNQDQTLGLIPHLQDQIKALNNQVDSLQQKIIQLESKLENPTPDDTKTIQQSDYTLEVKKGLICQKMIVKLEIQLLGEKIWNQKASRWKLISFHLEAPLSHFQEVISKSILKSRESPKSPKFYHFGNDFRAGENRNHSSRISTSSGRENIFEEVL